MKKIYILLFLFILSLWLQSSVSNELNNSISFELEGTWQSSKEVNSVYATTDRAYLGNSGNGVTVLDISTPSNPVLKNTHFYKNATKIIGDSNYIFAIIEGQVVDGRVQKDKILVFDISVASEQLIGEYHHDSFNNIGDITISSDKLFLTTSNSLIVVDIQNPSSPVKLGEYDLGYTNLTSPGVAAVGQIAYVAAGSQNFKILDASNPEDITLLGEYETDMWAVNVEVIDKTAYITGWESGLLAINVTDPYYPIKAGDFSIESPFIAIDIKVKDNFGYLTYNNLENRDAGIIGLNLHNLNNIEKAGEYTDLEWVNDIFFMDDYLLVPNKNDFTILKTSLYREAETVFSVSKELVELREGSSDILTISGGTPPYSSSSGDTSIAKATVVSDKLAIDGISEGTTEITVTDSASNALVVTVTVDKIEYLAVEPSSLAIPMLNTATFKISGGTGYYQITSTNTSVATYTVTDDTVTVRGESIGAAKIIIADSDNNSVLVPVTVTQKVKAIIVAASGPYTGNHLWDSTLACTSYAYKVLQYQGYTNETIQYLATETTLDINGDGIFDEVDGNATSSDLENAITSWALDAKDVLVYIVGHGSKDSLRIGQNELVTSSELNTWFNTLEGYIPGNLSFIYDACQSGSFLSSLKQTDSTKERILIASASPGENAYFTSLGSLSFSTLFWTQIHNGGNIRDSFAIAKNSIEYTYANQTPQLDDNGNGVGNEDGDGEVSQKTYVGNGVISAGDIPVIGDASSDKTLNGETSLVLYADSIIDSDTIKKVWAIITPPGFTTSDPDSPVLSVPTVEMNLVQNGKYEGIYTDFGSKGTYNLAFYAQDSEGNISLPKRVTITQKTESCQVDLVGHSVSGSQKTNNPVTFSMNAASGCSDTLYYRFSMHSDYGTTGYTGLKWDSMTDTEYQTDNSCTYTFTKAGKYIVVVWVVTDSTRASPTEVPIKGWSVNIKEEDSTCQTDIIGSSMSGTQEVNKPVTFTVDAQNDCSDKLYYRFSYHPYYGSDWYNGTHWTSMTDVEWISSNSVDYTFTETGKYIIVVWVSDDISDYEINGIPIIGWSVDIE